VLSDLLKAKWVIHTVGPVWNGGTKDEPELLASCYKTSLRLATELGAKTIAFPAISTGIYSFPADRAARIAIGTVAAELPKHPAITRAVFCCFSDASAQHHAAAAKELRLA